MKTVAQLNARSKVLALSASSFAKKLHIHMVDVLEHFKTHGDTSAATELFNLMPSSVRRDAIAGWYEAFGMSFVAGKDGAPAKFTKQKDFDLATINLEVALATSPWDLIKEKTFKPFDLMAQLVALLNRAEEKAKEEVPEGAKPNNVPEDLLAKVRLAIAA